MSEKLVKGMFGIIGFIWLISALLGLAVVGCIIYLAYIIVKHPESISAWFHRLTA